MVSKNNVQVKDRYATKQVPHYGIRKLSVGVASVLLSTTLYMGVTAHADTIAETSPQPTIDQPTNTGGGTSTSTGDATSDVQSKQTTDQPASTATNSPASETNASFKPVQTVSPEHPADTADVQPASDQLENAAVNSNAPKNNGIAASAPTVLSKQPANADTQSTATTSGVQPFVNLAVESDNNDLTSTRETVDSQWRIHYIDSTNHEYELKAPTVINMQYARTNTPQSDGTIQHGDWSYVPGSFKLTGTQITVNDRDNPVKEDNVVRDGKNEDVFTINAMYPIIAGYNFHNGISNIHLRDHLLNYDSNGTVQMPTMGSDFYVEYDPISERSVAVKFVDDQLMRQQVGQAITLTGHDGDTVNLNLTVPDKYQLADGQQLPTTYTFAKGSGNLTIHLTHKVVQREATFNVKLAMMTDVDIKGVDWTRSTITQEQWGQLGGEFNDAGSGAFFKILPSVEVGTLTGHVNYDVVNNSVVSLGNDWTTLNLGGHNYQLPNGVDVVNGVLIDSDDGSLGKPLREYYLKHYSIVNPGHNVDPDYATRPWYGYLSVNATNDPNSPLAEWNDLGLQGGLVGNESNALAKANGDRAAISVEMTNKTIDVSVLSTDFFSEQDGRLQATLPVPVVGVYVPYVEKTVTRTINVITPDGKTTTVKQTATLEKQVDLRKDAHLDWTTGEWTSYDVPTISGYTASQSNVAKEAVTGMTQDQTVNITYTANPQTATVVYQTEDGTPVHTTTVNGQTGQTVKVSSEVPVGWHVVNGTVPSEITFGPNGAPKTVITIDHSHITVTPDAPKTTGDKLPDNPDKAYPAGVGESDLNKTVTRTINVTTPDGKTKTVAQIAKLTRTADVDEITGEVKYSDWTTGEWANYDVPSVPGYAPNHFYVTQQIVTDTTKDQTIEITYTAQQQKIIINYIDDDAAGKVLHADVLTGLSGESSEYSIENHINDYVAKHYQLVSYDKNYDTSGQTLVFDNDTNTDQVYNVHLKHQITNISGGVIRFEKVHYQMSDGSTAPADYDQSFDFTRTGVHDAVTGVDNWNNWGPTSDHQFIAVQSPSVQGYTPDIQVVDAKTVTPTGNDINIIVTYTPDAQKLNVKFIDDTTGQVLKTVAKTGLTNASAGYNTQFDIQSYEGQHYVLVSDSSHGANLVFDNDDNTDQAYEVHLRHGAHQIDEHRTITQTVHYIATDHTGVPDDHTVSVQFDRDGYHDEVTGDDHWNAWKQGITQTFAEVPTPKKAGYTPDKSSVPATVVNPLDHNQTIDVTYTPDTQKVIITFIDDTDNGKTLKTVTKTGPTNSSAGYTTGNDINTYKDQHYVLVSDQTHGQNITFDTDKNADQRYEVHLKHGTHPINDQRTITETVHYKMADGTTAPADHTAKAEFSRDGFNDEVTGDDHWNAWTPSATHQFDAVQSPAVKGYTPDVDQIIAVAVNPDSQNIDRTVTYSPNVQIAHVKYIDDIDHKVLTQDDLTGRTGETSGYHTADRITEFKGQYYVLVLDNYPADGMTFDNNDRVDQTYEVHFTHATRTDEQDVQVPRTIKYVYQNGQQAQPDHTDALSFHETKVVDLVDGHTVSDDWTSAQDFKTIETPAIQGYTPDHASVSNAGIVHDHSAIVETVTYNPDAQKAVVKYIDDTTGEQLEAKDLDGVSDQSTGYNTKETIDGYVARHYDLVSDGTNGETITFDHDDVADQAYEVHFKHATAPVTDHRAKDLTVHYVYADGQARTGKAADDQTAPELTFNRTGVQDLVTNNIAWNAWDHADQTFALIDSPAIQGYTPDRTVVDNITVNSDTHDSIEVTVTYNADVQKLTINFIDDVTGQTLKTVTKTGYSDGNAAYSTKADIQNFVGQHYDLVSDATKGVNLVFDHNDGVDQVYNVHLSHHLTPISDHQVVNETIHYVYADGLARTGKAADDYTATPLKFNRTGKHDDVTGTDAWDAWTPVNANFAAVQSPVIQGYTPDQDQIDSASVNADSQDIVKTVTYSADQQTVTVDFIDDTDNGKVLKTVIKTGGSDEAVGYNTKADIQTFVDGHYKLDHDTSNGANLVFDHDDAVDQHYEVHLTHETAPIAESTSTNQVIHYQLADGTPVANDYNAKVDFSRDGFKDLVTNADHWNAWTPKATQMFDAVVSPAKAGYTPDHAQVDAVTVEPHHADLDTTVTYSPDAQKAAVKYIDDTTGKTLQTKELTGVSDETSTYTTESTIKQYVGQHYKLVSDQTNGKPVVFDHDDGSDQTFEVHLTHTYQSVSQEHQVHQTIHYQYADGKQARLDYTAKALAFSRTGIQDLVTENIQWNAWTPDQVFTAVDTPAVNGYTPDVQTVAPVKVGHDSKDIEQTVVYHADDQTILVNYIDDDTHSTLKTDSIVGKTAQTSDYTTKKSLDQYKGQHYDVVSDDTKGDTLTFDSDSTKVQTYNVHLKHQHQAASDKSTVHQIVHYAYQNGKQAAKDHTAIPIEFTRTGDTDLVTGKTTWNPWTPATGTFVAVLSPVITGYTPSRAMINHVNVHPGDKDFDTTVTYVPDRQVIVVNYIDQTTGKTLKTDTLNGHSDQTSGYTTKSQIDSYLGQHYKLISDATNGQTLTFDHDDQATQTYDVVLGHQIEAAHRTHEVHETVDYVYADGSQVAKSFIAQPIVFSQTGVHDLVTNITDWNGEWTKPQVFVAVESPKIIGFTASKPEVKTVEVNHQSSDVHELVIYAANAQTAQIKYIDDETGNTLEVDGANGHFNESIVFGHNVNDQINKFKQVHYKLVSNNFDGQKYQADNTKNVYEVHLTHERQNVHATDAVTETVKFQYVNGSQAQPTKTQTVNFGRDGIKDLVTGTTAWMPVDSQMIMAVEVPKIDGYTADIDQVPAVKVDFGDKDITKVVTYIANDQNAGIKIIDDTTGKVLNTQSAAGKFGTEIQFKQNPDQQVINLQAQHYELVSDNFKHQKYQADNAKNQFEIHVKHQMMDAQRTDKVTETVRYQDNHGNMLHPVTTQTKMLTEHGITDQVTGKTVWTPAKSQTMDAVSALEITGYTPNKSSVPATTVNFGDKDINEVIVYTPVSETSNIKYIDDTTGKMLLSDQTTGDFGSQIKFDHDPVAQINQYEGQGYKFVSNSYGKTAHQFSATSGENNFEVHFKHGTTPVIDTDKVTETIHYLGPDGNKLAPDNTQTITFTRHGIKDQVTGQIDWNSVEPQEFNAVKSPVINGYQADIAVVEGRQVLFGDQDVVVNVHYTKLPEQQFGKQPGTGMVNTGKVTPDTGKHLGTGMANTGKVTPEKVVAVANGIVQETKQNPAKNSAQSTMQDTKRLPQTGNDDRAGLLSLIGSGLMAGLAIFGLGKKKNHEN